VYSIKKILCPTDFSTFSRNALHAAVQLAQQQEAEITLLHVDEFEMSPMGYFQIFDEDIRRYRDVKTKFLKEQLNAFVDENVPQGMIVHKRIVPGRAYKVVVELAEAEKFDLIVIARRGTTNLSDHLVGSTAERVVRLARCPVLSIRGVNASMQRPLGNILCPTDYSPSANAALSYAMSIAAVYGSKLYILHISELDAGHDIEEVKKRAPSLEEINPDVTGLDAEFVFDRDIEPNNSIIRFSEDRDIDLIVMSTHGKRGLRRVFIGNNTAEVVRKAECPVLTMSHPVHKVVFSKLATQGEVEPFGDQD
jgi:nucleotide-binding universal stress UspA family protein